MTATQYKTISWKKLSFYVYSYYVFTHMQQKHKKLIRIQPAFSQ